MALVSSGYELRVALIDSAGDQATRVYDLTAATAAEAETDSTTILGLLAAISDAVVKGYTVGHRFVEDALAYPVGGVEVEDLALVTARIDGSPDKTVNFTIPAPKDGIFVAVTGPSRNIVDTADLDLIAYASTWNPGGNATISDGESIELPLLLGKRIKRGGRG